MSLARLFGRLGYQFADQGLLQTALTHRSFGTPNNERMEFLGDAILGCVITSILYDKFPDLTEGQLSRQRASLVRQEALQIVAQTLCLGELIRLGEGERKTGGSQRASILADTFEAIIGAVHLDGGAGAAKSVIERLFADSIASLDPSINAKDAKTSLQELLQGRRMGLPRYEVCEVRGEAHDQEFEVECVVAEYDLRCRGVGRSRSTAEQVAATGALSTLQECIR